MININCPVCANSEVDRHTILFEIKEDNSRIYNIRKCSKCYSIYTYFKHPVNIEIYYDEKDYTVRDTQKTVFYKIQEYEYNRVLKKIKKLLTLRPLSLLDFGCGKGLFLQFAKKLGFEGKGIESSKPRANYAKKKFGLEVNTDFYSKGKVFEKNFTLITLFHVLEHIIPPIGTLENLVKDNLDEGGLLVVEVPNMESWQSKWSGKRWLHLDVPRHITHFTPQSLSMAIKQSGCTVLKEEYFSFHLGIVGMIQTIFSWFGYKGFLIGDLKEKKSLALYLKIGLVLPFAVMLETLASTCKKGGVIRYYAVKNR